MMPRSICLTSKTKIWFASLYYDIFISTTLFCEFCINNFLQEFDCVEKNLRFGAKSQKLKSHGNELKMYEGKGNWTPFKTKLHIFGVGTWRTRERSLTYSWNYGGSKAPFFKVFLRAGDLKKSSDVQKTSVCAKYWEMKRGELSISRSSSFFYTPHKIFTIFSLKTLFNPNFPKKVKENGARMNNS